MKFAWVLGIVCSFAMANEVAPQLVVGEAFACMLSAPAGGGENLVRCWDNAGREVTSPRLKDVEQLTAVGNLACAVSKTQTHCWAPVSSSHGGNDQDYARRVAHAFPELPSLFRGSPGATVCGWSSKGLRCFSHKALKPEVEKASQRMLSSAENRPIALAVNSYTVCDLSAKGEVHCWGKNDYDDKVPTLLKYSPTNPSPAQELAVNEARICALEDDHLHCWGEWDQKNDVITKPLVAPLSLSMTNEAALVLDDGKLWKLKLDGQLQQATDGPGRLEHIGLLGASESSYCTATDTELACHLDLNCHCHDRKPDEDVYDFRVAHGMQVVPAEIGAFDTLLNQMATNIYPEKKLLLLTAVQLAKPLSARGKLFVYHALSPVVENVDSDFVNKEILPAYGRLRAHFGKRFQMSSPAEFPVSPENNTSALRLTLAAVTSLNGVSSSWQELTLKIGEALATADAKAINQVLYALEAAKAEVDTYLARPRTKGQAQLLLDLMSYLRKVK